MARHGAVARHQLAEVLVDSLTSDEALRKTFELVAETGPATHDFNRLFDTADADVIGLHDAANMPLDQEPPEVLKELDSVRAC
jgi:hypothetical protein